MYRTRQIRIRKGNRLYRYCTDICHSALRLYNRGTYLVRQYVTAVQRLEKGEELTENQKNAYEMIRAVTKGTKYEPKTPWLNYGRLDYILKSINDESYFAMPSQANQQTLKVIMRDFASFFGGIEKYKKHPEEFKGRPKLPGYKKKGGLATAILTNQICKILDGKYLRFPLTGNKVNIGKQPAGTRLKEVRIKPRADEFVIDVVMEYAEDKDLAWENPLLEMEEKKLVKHLKEIENCHYRVVGIDPGTTNFCAVTNNFGEKPFLVKGGLIKARNNFYNKELARMVSQAKKCNDTYMTKRISRLHEKRFRIMKDLMHKASSYIADWAAEQQVDLVLFGHNIFQKQQINMGHENNQTFVQIPFRVFADMLKYKLNERGIAFLETEEAYTSQADFFAMNPIPKYEKGKQPPKMSGRRIHRGLYRHSNGKLSNADINGAANIIRKVFPNVKEWDKGIVDMPYAVFTA
ncbi:MAG: RNA-guided endonuclease TnpB family protein [Lachnospiraceae bacterium]|nr:RNA-guided endonuclease TnpB family protein [Lachnospiraceae bacterium]